MKRILIVLACMVIPLFTGCELTFSSVDNLMKPPKLTEEQNRIDAALRDSVWDAINLVYPKTGDYKSAFIVENIDDEDSTEAIVFYKTNAGTGSVRMNILDQQNGEWVSVWDNTTVNGTEIEKVSFIKTGGRVYLVLGVNVASASDKTLIIYEYAQRVLKQVFTTTCANFAVYDLNDDGNEEIITLTHTMLSDTKKETTAQLYSLYQEECRQLSQTRMDEEVSSYVNIFPGKLPDGTPALFLDTQQGADQYGTEILTAVNNRLQNPILMYGLKEKTYRYAGLSSMKGENESYLVPQTITLPGYSEAAVAEQPYLINWYQYDSKTQSLTAQDTTYTNYVLGYSFKIPEKWLDSGEGQITAKRNATNNELTFFIYHGDLKNEAETLLKIRPFSRSSLDQDTSLPYGYTMLGSNGQMVYAYNLKVTHSEFDLTPNEVQQLFSILQ